jgi:hypothetical protein
MNTTDTSSGSSLDPLGSAIRAAEQMDWVQVVLNGGPPCFHVDADDGRFCGRAERWKGHGPLHEFVSLADLLRTITPNGELSSGEKAP